MKTFIYLAKTWFLPLSSNLFIKVLILSFISPISVKPMIFPVPFLYASRNLILVSSKLKDTFFSNSSIEANFVLNKLFNYIRVNATCCFSTIYIFFKRIYMWQNNEFVTFYLLFDDRQLAKLNKYSSNI